MHDRRTTGSRLTAIARWPLVAWLLLALPGAGFELDLDAGSGTLDATAVAEALAARDDPAAAPIPDDERLWQRARALVPIVVERGCAPYLLGAQANAFGESSAACDAFLASALV
ncbi:MAG: hypothetical protein JXR83_11720, partial [Deltaproteobacteria bacterium]|nr:hypothetical protein [Deltaproteobacteria bacterium]